jgi:arsenite methyltransferase
MMDMENGAMDVPTVQQSAPQKKVNYGLDAPVFQRSALFGGLTAVALSWVLQEIGNHNQSQVAWWFSGFLFWPGVSFFFVGCVMLWGSKVGKLRLRDKVIESVAWRGHEQVLDVGCGHGLMLLAAAKRLTVGRATGIDVWSQVDQAANHPEATMENARLESVAERVEVRSGDARALPFQDASFDVVLSSWVIHNLARAGDREQIVREIARVLKPGGQIAIVDIRHTGQYARVLRALGWTEVDRRFPNFLFVTPTRVLRARKPEKTPPSSEVDN